MKTRMYKKIALVLSLCLLIVWALLGTGASLAWFTDTSSEVTNIFHAADFKLTVSHRLTDGKWEKIDEKTKVFNDEALYEPGYVQVVYLKVENEGDRAFTFHTAVNVNGYIVATNVFGTSFNLQDYLRFGLVSSDTEEQMKTCVPDRETAKRLANEKLHNYHTEAAVLQAGETTYLTLIVRMPEEVGNVANYRGDTVPKVELGLTVKADQMGV